MTIIQPNKNNNKINFLISILILAGFVFSTWAIFLYNQMVGFKHDIDKIEKLVQQKEVENAELKNNLYAMIDLKREESLANGGDLVLERSPQYIKNQ